jgi:hypothetical protein
MVNNLVEVASSGRASIRNLDAVYIIEHSSFPHTLELHFVIR